MQLRSGIIFTKKLCYIVVGMCTGRNPAQSGPTRDPGMHENQTRNPARQGSVRVAGLERVSVFLHFFPFFGKTRPGPARPVQPVTRKCNKNVTRDPARLGFGRVSGGS